MARTTPEIVSMIDRACFYSGRIEPLWVAAGIPIGSAVTGLEQGQQIAGLLNLVFGLPMYVMPVLFENPGHPLIVILTLLPPTAFMSIALRWGLGTVPIWQLALSWVLLIASAAAVIWIAARVFRASMLRYGQELSQKGIVAALRG